MRGRKRGERNDVLCRSPKAGSRFERRSLTFFRSPGSRLPRSTSFPTFQTISRSFPSFLCYARHLSSSIKRRGSQCGIATGRLMVQSSFRLSAVLRYHAAINPFSPSASISLARLHLSYRRISELFLIQRNNFWRK